MSKTYDVVVLGGGVGGYTAAIRAAQLGMSTALVEVDKLGGTCLHRGCIPTKAYLRSAEVLAEAKEAGTFGVKVEGVSLDFRRVADRKRQIVDQLYKGVTFLMKKNKIDVYSGRGRLIGPSIFSPRAGSVAVELADGETETLVPGHLVIATGSRARALPGLEPDGTTVLTSDHALEMTEIPESVLIVGGGVIGVEWASLLCDFGAEVTVIEAEERILPLEDEEVSRELAKILSKRGVRILTGAKVLAETLLKTEEGVRITVKGLQTDSRAGASAADKGDGTLELTAEKMLVSVGRSANTEGIGLENTDIQLDKGFIKVDGFMRTMENHIYAVGDVNGRMQLAHAAAHQAVMAVEHIAGNSVEPFEPRLVPRCIYTRTEVASVGWTEKQAEANGHQVRTGKFPFRALGKALVLGDRDGFVKVVADAKTNDILGVHMIGPHVTDSISEAALAQVLDAVPWEVGQTIHPHPTLSEALAEAMLAVEGRAINF